MVQFIKELGVANHDISLKVRKLSRLLETFFTKYWQNISK